MKIQNPESNLQPAFAGAHALAHESLAEPRSTSVLVRWFETLTLWHARHVQRHELAHLSPHILRDIGLDRIAALHEAHKPFWRP